MALLVNVVPDIASDEASHSFHLFRRKARTSEIQAYHESLVSIRIDSDSGLKTDKLRLFKRQRLFAKDEALDLWRNPMIYTIKLSELDGARRVKK